MRAIDTCDGLVFAAAILRVFVYDILVIALVLGSHMSGLHIMICMYVYIYIYINTYVYIMCAIHI